MWCIVCRACLTIIVACRINPVIGCYEEPKHNPMADMSDEQKEHEAMQLVKMMEQLTSAGVVKPCRVGEDGKPYPVDHILQLRDEPEGHDEGTISD
jgi:hypothetical protein